MTKDIEREALEGEIELFIEEAMKSYVVERWADSYQHTPPFDYVINDKNEVWWMKAQAHQLWQFWQAAKAQAVPDTYTQIVLALESVQSKIAKTSFLTMDEENENEVMAVDANELAAYIDKLIEAQEPTND